MKHSVYPMGRLLMQDENLMQIVIKRFLTKKNKGSFTLSSFEGSNPSVSPTGV